MNETIEKLIEFIETASPVVWSILIKQVYAEAFANLAWVVFLVILAVVAYKLVSRVRKQDDDTDMWSEEKIVIGYIVFGVSTAIAFGVLNSAILHMANPEFYAIRFILTQISGQ